MEITISLGKNFKISDKALEDFKNMVKDGRCLGTLDHPEPSLSLIDTRYKVDEIRENVLGELVGDITILNNPEGNMFRDIIQKNPNSFRFSPTGFCHKETNPETGDEETIIDAITAINATPNYYSVLDWMEEARGVKEAIDINEFLSVLYNLHKELASISSTKAKIEILTKFKNGREYTDKMSYYDKIFNYIYDNDVTFGITSEKVDSFEKDTVGRRYGNFMSLLDDLASRKLTGDAALASTKKFIGVISECYNENSENMVKMFKMILDKDFECGVNVKTMAKVFPVKLPFTEYVALANKYFDREDKVDFEKEIWYRSRKLDGNRLILIKNQNGVRCISRQGKEIKTLDVLRSVISQVEGDFVLDGEVCIIDENGNENFQEIMKVITKKNYTIEHPVMKVFDILTEDEFYGRTVSDKFSLRYSRLKTLFIDNEYKICENFNLVEQTLVRSKEDLMDAFAESRKKGWEGLMIRKDVPYECGRTNNLLKVKGFFDNEYEVVGYEMGDMRFVEEGRQVEKEVLSAIIIKHKGFDVKVGSGFSKEQREYLHDHPEEIVGSIVKVQYFEETNNMQGGISLRFPTVVYFYGKDGRFD